MIILSNKFLSPFQDLQCLVHSERKENTSLVSVILLGIFYYVKEKNIIKVKRRLIIVLLWIFFIPRIILDFVQMKTL